MVGQRERYLFSKRIAVFIPFYVFGFCFRTLAISVLFRVLSLLTIIKHVTVLSVSNTYCP